MAGMHNQIATGLAALAASVTGMTGCSPVPVETIPNTPYGVIGPPKGSLLQPGSWERLLLQYPMRIYVCRVGTPDRDQVVVSDLVDLFLVTFRTGIELGTIVTEAIIKTWDTDRFYTVGGEDYQAIDWLVGVEVERPATYTA